MLLALKAQHGIPEVAPVNDNRRATPLRDVGWNPEVDDRPMVIVYAVSTLLIVIGLFLLSL
jgi:hypothetical protein